MIDTVAKRSRLAPRKNPYWTSVAGGRGGTSLGYRKTERGAGAWVGKVVVGGKRVEQKLGTADDPEERGAVLNYAAAVAAALEWGRRQMAALEADTGARLTVRIAVHAYMKTRVARSKSDGANAEGRLQRHVLADKKFSDTPLASLRATTIEQWREGLLIDRNTTNHRQRALSPSSVNRLLNDFRAALNLAVLKHHRELPAHLSQEIRVGTKSIEAVGEVRRQLMTDDQVRNLIEAAFEMDPDGDFGRLVTLLAATGARYSQVTALKVADFQPDQHRVLMPGSRKGRSRKPKPPVAIPLETDVVERLRPAFEGRNDADGPLLMRWYHRKTGRTTWAREARRRWGPPYNTVPHWPRTVKAAGMPASTVMYAFRHSSIVRGLRAGLPLRLVAALHDTSSEMIEEHYAAFIVDATEDLARRATLSMSRSTSKAQATQIQPV